VQFIEGEAGNPCEMRGKTPLYVTLKSCI